VNLPNARKAEAFSARSGSSVARSPPSPEVMVLFAWKLKDPYAPQLPDGRLSQRASMAWALSSTMARPCFSASAAMADMSAICPPRCTGMSARVRGVMRRAQSRTSRQ
jgi:hypothetical protein